MRILRIAGQNLASLERFEVDFDAEPLRTAGLFAITGPTGAGKSTLLDAVCVALYDRTPRLSDSGGVAVQDVCGEDGQRLQIGANDVRALLRRGAGEGFAEVDFRVANAQVYRARWTVQRAHKKAGGRLQDQKVQLHRLGPGGELAENLTEHGKGATLERISRLIGLTFEQFRRAVLLAQGDFAAFLRARPGERAELLERMTDTGIYAEISKQAHEEAALQTWLVRLLEAKAGGLARLSVAERQGAEEALLRAEQDAHRATAAEAQARTALAWHSERAALAGRLADADRARAAARQAQLDALPREQESEAVEAAQAWRSQVEGADTRLAQRLRSEALAQQAAQEAALRTAAYATAQQGAAQAQAAHVDAQRTLDAARPELELARTLDGQLGDLGKRLRTASDDARERCQVAKDAAGAAMAARATRQRTAEELARQVAWLSEHEGDAELVRQWPAWRVLLAAALKEREHVREWTAQRDHGAALLPRLTGDATAAGEAAAQCVAQLAAAEAEAGAAEQEVSALDLQALADGRRTLIAAQDNARKLGEIASLAVTAAAEERRLADDRAARLSDAAHADGACREATAHALQVRAQWGEAATALRLLQASLDLAGQRHLLVDGSPCPLCGALEHPYAAGAAPLPVAAQQARVTQLEEELRGVESYGQAQAAQRDAAHAGLAQAEPLERKVAARRAELASAWIAAWPEAPLPAEQSVELLREQWAELSRQSDALQAREAAQRAAQQRANEASAKARKIRGLEEGARMRKSEADKALMTVQTRLGTIDRDIDAAVARGSASIEHLAPLWALRPAARHEVDTAPENLLSALAASVQAFAEAAGARDQLQTTQLTQQGQEDLAQARAASAETAARAAEDLRDALQRDLGALTAARAECLGGREASAVEQALQGAQQTAQLHAATCDRVANAALGEQAAAQAKAEQWALQALEAAQEAARARDDLDRILARLAMAESELRRLLGFDLAWRNAQRAELQALAGALSQAEGAFQAAQAELEQHAASPAPALQAEAASAQVEQARQQLQEANQRLGQLRAQLGADDQLRAQAAELELRVTQQTLAARRWQDLDEAIGSQDGKKFRLYAQGLTLDVLTAHANHHLAELAPRYRLQRVPGVDLELQVIDRDLGDEVRALTTLSGGETFLVSLALALGLASLSTKGTALESLFIDEGFGTLDPETLEVALSVLDGLQASGRRVGLISHVPGLAERLGVQIRVLPRGAGRSTVRVALA